MARLPRYTLPGQPQHVIQRGNNRDPIFVADDDYRFFRACLIDGAKRYPCDIHAYVLMTNHVHLLVTPRSAGALGTLLQSVGRRYVQYFNDTYQRTGTLWEGRYRATLIDSASYLLTCYRYIELNPVRAQMVAHARDYPWSSYRAHAEAAVDEVISEHRLYRRLGKTAEERQAAYRQLFKSHLGEAVLEEIREATNKAWVLGGERFKDKIETLAQRRTRPLPKGRPRMGSELQETEGKAVG